MIDAFTVYWHEMWFKWTRIYPITMAIRGLVYLKFYNKPKIASSLSEQIKEIESTVQNLFFIKEVSDRMSERPGKRKPVHRRSIKLSSD
jgi:hypothetical protein